MGLPQLFVLIAEQVICSVGYQHLSLTLQLVAGVLRCMLICTCCSPCPGHGHSGALSFSLWRLVLGKLQSESAKCGAWKCWSCSSQSRTTELPWLVARCTDHTDTESLYTGLSGLLWSKKLELCKFCHNTGYDKTYACVSYFAVNLKETQCELLITHTNNMSPWHQFSFECEMTTEPSVFECEMTTEPSVFDDSLFTVSSWMLSIRN